MKNRIVLITGFETFNSNLYRQAATKATSRCPNLEVIVFSDTSIATEGVAGTIAMLLLGQVLAGMLTDHFGWFGLPQRRISVRDLAQVLLVLSGSGFLLYG